MQPHSKHKSPFSLVSDNENRKNILSFLKHPIERVLSLRGCEKIYERISNLDTPLAFMRGLLSEMNISTTTTGEQRTLIPPEGPVIVIANHPFGAIEGIILAELLCSIRPDVKAMANFLLERIPQLKDLFISVDPFASRKSVRSNVRPMRDALRWVRGGHMLMVFPAGEVSHIKLSKREISDPVWNAGVSKIVKKAKAPVLPVFFQGSNSAFFQLAGLLHPRFRTAMLARELLNKRRKSIDLKIGKPIPFHRLRQFEKDRDLMDYLRWRTYLLGHSSLHHKNRISWQKKNGSRSLKPIPGPRPSDSLKLEIERLPSDQQLAEKGDYMVWHAESHQIPRLLQEIGRLREITFRSANEGTGKSLDIDRFDTHYHHLFIWHRNAEEIVGAYRFGCTDVILSQFGTKGLYTSTLFRSSRRFFDAIGPALELGRSFVRPEYQRSYAPLLLLWKGIGGFISRHPRYRMLFGPVSISRDYSDLSRQLIASTLVKQSEVKELAAMIRPKTPPKMKPIRLPGAGPSYAQRFCYDMDEVCSVIGEIEFSVSNIPILLKHYLNIGGQLLSFNIDKNFGDAMDGLILVDLLQSNGKTLQRYFGKDGLEAFYSYHRDNPESPRIQSPALTGLLKAG